MMEISPGMAFPPTQSSIHMSNSVNGISNNISKMGLQNLQHEPQRLQSESDNLNSELEYLVMENYQIFIENLTCSVELKVEDKKLNDIKNKLNDELRSLSHTCSSFRDRVSAFVGSHKRNRKTLQHHMQLVELLEIPQLVDACARNGFYDEALELANFVNGLERRHLLASEVRSVDGPQRRGGSNVVQTIVEDVYNTLLLLRSQLLQLLTESSSLPKDLQILGTLRKLDTILIDRQLAVERHDNESLAALSDSERDNLRQHLLKSAEVRLQMDFLEARTTWMIRIHERAFHAASSSQYAMFLSQIGEPELKSSNLPSVNPNSASSQSVASLGPYGKVMEMLEANRTAWFTIVTQFNALFSDMSATSAASSTTPAILTAWMSKQIQRLLLQLQTSLPHIDEGGSLRSVMEQSLFFASRMGEVGCDFSSLLIPLFQSTLVGRIVSEWKIAADHFKAILTSERMMIEGEDSVREQVVPLYICNDDSSPAISLSSGSSAQQSNRKLFDELGAPSSLLSFPPLAFLLNAILSGLNFLRECPMITARTVLLSELHDIITDLINYFVKIGNQLQAKGVKYFTARPTAVAASAAKKGSSASVVVAGRATAGTTGFVASDVADLSALYSAAIAHDLLPHVLSCFDAIYTAGSGGAKQQLRIDQLYKAKGVLSKESFSILEQSWGILSDSKMIPKEAMLMSPVVAVAPIPLTEATKSSDDKFASESSTSDQPADISEVNSTAVSDISSATETQQLQKQD